MKDVYFVRIEALKGVCIGVGKYLTPGQTAKIPSEEAYFLSLAGQVSILDDCETIENLQPAPQFQPC